MQATQEYDITIYQLIGVVGNAMRQQGKVDQRAEFESRAFNADTVEEVQRIAAEYVRL